jgi:predicted type IV restriction endonuclease
MKITPYEYEKIGNTNFIINYDGEMFLTIENTTENQVKKTTQLLNGAFREGVIFGQFNKIESL